MNKKNLDQLFQEKLKDLSDVPDEKVWQAIEASLNKKKKTRTVIPIWWKLGGVAAVLAIALFFIIPSGDTNVTTPVITDVESTEEKHPNEPLRENSFETPEVSNEAVVITDKGNTTKISDVTDENSTHTNTVEKNSASTVAVEKTSTANNASIIKNPSGRDSQLVTNQVVGTEKKEQINTAVKDKELIIVPKNGKEAVAIIDADKSDDAIEERITGQNDKSNSSEIAALVKSDNSDNLNTKAIAEVEKEEVQKNAIDDPKKKSIFDEIAAQDAEEELLAENNGGKWSAGPSIAPVYFSSIGEGSPVHSDFVANSKSGSVNLSYGVFVSYKINDKLSVRSGIHKVDYGYDTNEIAFSSSLARSNTAKIDNINYGSNAKNLIVESVISVPTNDLKNEALNIADVSAKTTSRDGSLVQQFGYLEVPFELNYKVIDRKFGIDLIGGVSSLFLVDNSITLTSGQLTTEVGEANNINNVNFSGNIGLGLNYKFTSKLQFNIEPLFKYQFNTFSDISGDFQPFSVGIYSGLSFKF